MFRQHLTSFFNIESITFSTLELIDQDRGFAVSKDDDDDDDDDEISQVGVKANE